MGNLGIGLRKEQTAIDDNSKEKNCRLFLNQRHKKDRPTPPPHQKLALV